MTRTTTYVVYRYGSNAANQHMQQVAVLGAVNAASRQEAVDKAPTELRATVYNNQYLDAKPWSRVSEKDRDLAFAVNAELDACRDEAY